MHARKLTYRELRRKALHNAQHYRRLRLHGALDSIQHEMVRLRRLLREGKIELGDLRGVLALHRLKV